MLSQSELLIGILHELERQCPGAYVTQDTMNALIIAVDFMTAAQHVTESDEIA